MAQQPANDSETPDNGTWITMEEASLRLGIHRQMLWSIVRQEGIEPERREINGTQTTAIRDWDLTLVQAVLTTKSKAHSTRGHKVKGAPRHVVDSQQAQLARLAAELSKERKQRERALTEVERALVERDEVADKADELQGQLKETSNSLLSVRTELAHERKHTKELQSRASKREEDLSRAEETLESERDNRQAAEDELKGAVSAESATSSYAERLADENRSLKTEIARLRGELHEVHGDRRKQEREAEASKERLRISIEETAAERDEHNALRQEVKQERAVLEERVRKLNEHVDALKRSLTQSLALEKNAQRFADKSERRNEQLQEKARVLQGRLQAETARRQHVEADLAGLQKELSETRVELHTARRECELEMDRAEGLSESHARALIELNLAESENARLEERLRDASDQERGLERYADRLERQLNELRAIDELEELPVDAQRTA